MDVLKIERIGGLAGFGLPGSKLQSRGEQSLSVLTAADQARVTALFESPSQAAAGHVADGFRYRITRTIQGRDQTVEVPENAVPAALKACVTDQLL